VGSTILKQAAFQSLYRSTNIEDIKDKYFETVVCAAAPAQKWIANREPEEDCRKIEALIENIRTVKCKKFILISTVDVFKKPIDVNESTVVDLDGLHAYGKNRRLLEQFVENYFEDCLIVRLPGLVGPGLRKNVIFDFLNNNNLHMIDSRGVFQFYPMVNLWYDIQVALTAGLKLIHLTAEPISVENVANQGFGLGFNHTLDGAPAVYNMQTQYAELFGASDGYQYSSRETIQAIRAYAQSELSMAIVDSEEAK